MGSYQAISRNCRLFLSKRPIVDLRFRVPFIVYNVALVPLVHKNLISSTTLADFVEYLSLLPKVLRTK